MQQEIESNGGLTPREAQIVARTVAGDTPTAIAAALGLSVHTCYRCLRLAHVKLAITEARAAEVRPLVAQAVGEAQKSVERLVAVRDGETTRDGDRVRASVAILAWFRDVWQMGEVLPRIAAVEAAINNVGDRFGTEISETGGASFKANTVPDGLVGDD